MQINHTIDPKQLGSWLYLDGKRCKSRAKLLHIEAFYAMYGLTYQVGIN